MQPTDLPGTMPDVDRVAVAQALTDAEVAIVRAADLARRLVELTAELEHARAENQQLRTEVQHVQHLYDEIVGNRAYGLASRVWQVRRAIGG